MMMSNPTVQVPPWSSPLDDPTAGLGFHLPVSGVNGTVSAGDCSPYLLGEAALAALQRYLPSSNDFGGTTDDDVLSDESDTPVDAYSSDDFRMYEFKVLRCARGRSHDWTECPFAHPGEKARRRDPRKYHYSGTACPDFRKGSCKRGDACEFAHGVFECWLHPARYRTQPCKDGTACRRRVCFFAHTPDQLRILPQQQPHSPKSPSAVVMESYDGSPLRHQALESYMVSKNHHHHHLMSSSPTSTLLSPPISPPSESPPVSPSAAAPLRRGSWSAVGSSVNDLVASLRQLQLNKVKSSPSSSWAFQLGNACGFCSPTAAVCSPVALSKSGFCSLPATPTRSLTAAGGLGGWFDGLEEEEEPVERVESGRALRAKMFEKLSKDGLTEKLEAGSAAAAPDVAWVSELVK